MLRRVRGTVAELGEDRLWLWVGGVELELLAPGGTLAALSEGTKATLYVHLLWREEGPLLLAFGNEAERATFQALLAVSGVGPKVALGLLDTLGPEGIAAAVAGGDPAALTAAPGVGRKVAERIALELKNRLPAPATASPGGARPEAREAIEALLLLGFREGAVRKAVARLAGAHPEASAEELIRLALKELR